MLIVWGYRFAPEVSILIMFSNRWDTSIELTLDRYSHWISSMGRHAADGMDEALG
jgi:hypothetical protein